jgi:glycosyltransferase involved in cell wall biosynthesis
MRLLILSQYFWPENFRINDLAAGLIARGHEVTVLTGLPNYPDGKIFKSFQDEPDAFASFEGADVLRVPMLPRGEGNLRLVLNYLSFVIGGLVRGPALLKGRRFDAIFVFQTSPITSALPALWLRRRRGTPVLLWVLDLWPDTLSAIGVVRSPRLLALVGKLVSFIYRRCDRILIQSRAFLVNVARYSQDTGKVRYFPGWAEAVFAEMGDAEPAPELAPYRDDFKLLFAGNIGEAQDFPALIAAAELLRDVPNLRFIVVGDGRAADAARADVARRGLQDRVLFLGRYPLERMPSFFIAADALLVSLVDRPIWAMTIPGKVQSYLASGKPLLAMLNGEGARVIDEAGAGLTSPAGDAAAFAANVRALMALPAAEREQMGLAGRAYCGREFGREELIDRLEQWIEELQPPAR